MASTFGAGDRLTKLEMGTSPFAGADLQIVESPDAAVFFSGNGPDVHRIVGSIGSILADLDSVGDQLDGDTDLGDIGSVECGLGPVNAQFPFDAGQRTGIVDIDDLINGIQIGAQLGYCRFQQIARV